MMQTIDCVNVIVRSVGERTEKVCVERLKNAFPEKRLHVLRNIVPFWRAVERSFQIAISEETAWTLIIDADVIIWEDKLVSFIEMANMILDEVGEEVFCIQPFVFDHVFDTARLAGVHLYRTSRIKRALKYCQNNSVRPETYVKQRMCEEGIKSYTVSSIVGIHDFFQYYSSLVKKGILHAKKHSQIDKIEEKLLNGIDEYDDYKWVLKGIEIGRKIADVTVDNDYMEKLLDEAGIILPEQELLDDKEVDVTLSRLKNVLIWEEAFRALDGKSKKENLKDALLQYRFFQLIKKVKKICTSWVLRGGE